MRALGIIVLFSMFASGCLDPADNRPTGPATGAVTSFPEADATLLHDSCGLVSLIASKEDPRWRIGLNPPAYRINLQETNIVRYRMDGSWIAVEVEVGPAVFRPFEEPLINRAYPNETGQGLIFYNIETFELREAGPCAHSEDPYLCAVYWLHRSQPGVFFYTRPTRPETCDDPDEMVLYDPLNDAETIFMPTHPAADPQRFAYVADYSDGTWVVYHSQASELNTTKEHGSWVERISDGKAYQLSSFVDPRGSPRMAGNVAIWQGALYYFVSDFWSDGRGSYGNSSQLMKLDLATGDPQELTRFPFATGGILAIEGPWLLWEGRGQNAHVFNLETSANKPISPESYWSINAHLVNDHVVYMKDGPGSPDFIPGIYDLDLSTGLEHLVLRKDAPYAYQSFPVASGERILLDFLGIRNLDGTFMRDASMVWLYR